MSFGPVLTLAVYRTARWPRREEGFMALGLVERVYAPHIWFAHQARWYREYVAWCSEWAQRRGEKDRAETLTEREAEQ